MTHETRSETPQWQHNGIEEVYKELHDARIRAAVGIKSNLLELAGQLTEDDSIRIGYKVRDMEKYDLVFSPKDGTLMHEVWETHIFADDVPSHSQSYGSRIEIESVGPFKTNEFPVTPEGHPHIWIESGRKLAQAIHKKLGNRTSK